MSNIEPTLSAVRAVSLSVRGITVPAFKNRKRAIQMSNGKLRTLTDPKTHQRMEQIIRAFVSELCYALPITEGETWTEQQLQSWIASFLPEDDSRQWIPELSVLCEQVKKGNEGFTIEIEIWPD